MRGGRRVKTLKVEHMGDAVQGVRFCGDPERSPEPIHFRVVFPGGDVEVVRVSDGEKSDYWVHVRVNRPGDMPEGDDAMSGRLASARLDVAGKQVPNIGDFDHPGLYHLALRIQPKWPKLPRGTPSEGGKQRRRRAAAR
jgi:hypothetical protein